MQQQKKEIILLNISGEDKAGLTASLTQILSLYNVQILDIGQATIHDDLALGILFEVPQESESSPILKDLLFKSYEMGVNVKFTPISEERYNGWVNHQGKDRYILTLLARKLTAEHLAQTTSIIAEQGLNIDLITRLTGRTPLDGDVNKSKAVVELSVRVLLRILIK